MNPIDVNFLVRPIDTLYFGPPRSFSAGENHRGKSIFPPTPNTFQGIVRARLLQAADPPLDLQNWSVSARSERESLVGSPEKLPGDWLLRGPFPAITRTSFHEDLEIPQLEPWVATPRFLMSQSNKTGDVPVIARPVSSTHPRLNDLGASYILFGDPRRNILRSIGGWIGPDNLYFALTGKGSWKREQHSPDYPPFVFPEPNPGVAIDGKTGTARHSLLYFLETLRFKEGSGLMGNFSGTVDNRIPPDALISGTGYVGRKGRLVAFEQAADLHPKWQEIMKGEHLPHSVGEDDRFWLINLTPAALAEPGIPEKNPAASGHAGFEIVASLTGKPLYLGGYSMATGKSRPNRAYAPAGSAWWIKIKGRNDNERARILRSLNNANILANEAEASFGFGHCIVGISKYDY
ncbi:MAG: hypothetical protein GWP10_12060 [Nitrospiraceae bacterium]|nr:hypothetical protein [Nitrospiraceae bacterium]